MATKLENLYRESTDIMDKKGSLEDEQLKISDNRTTIKSILESFLDQSEVEIVASLDNALEKESNSVQKGIRENEIDRGNVIEETEKYIDGLESNLLKLQEIKIVSNLGQSELGAEQTTERRIGELKKIRELLEGEESSSRKTGIEINNKASYNKSENRRNTFLESIKVQVEPIVVSQYGENIYSEINKADNQQLVQIIKKYKLASDADFGNLDNEVACQMVKSVYETKKQFDFIDMNFIGSIQARNDRIASKLFDIYMAEYQRLNPEWSREELKPFVDKLVKENVEKIKPAINTMAQSVFVEYPADGLSLATSYFAGISVNESYGSDYQSFTKVKENEVLIGHKPKGCGTVKATIDHELGHQIANKLNACSDGNIVEIYKKFSRLSEVEQAGTLSTYAAKNIGEFVAECWSEYSNNLQCRKVAAFVSKRLIDLNEAEEIGPKILERGFSR